MKILLPTVFWEKIWTYLLVHTHSNYCEVHESDFFNMSSVAGESKMQ